MLRVITDHQCHGRRHVFLHAQCAFHVGQHGQQFERAFAHERLADLFAVEISVECGPEQNLLCAVGFDRGGAVEFERASS